MTSVVRVEVQLWSSEPEAVSAVRRTIEQAPLSAVLTEEDGRFFIEGSPFAVWAAEKQGYVKGIVKD